MYLEKLTLSNFQCFSEDKTEIGFDENLTCFVGNNGSGKTAFITALKRLFGLTKEERTIVRNDFHLSPKEDYSSIGDRKLFIEATFSFPQLKGKSIAEARNSAPAFDTVIYADNNTGNLKAKIRLEAVWNEAEYDDDVEFKIYWITTSEDVGFGEDKDCKFPVSSYERKRIRLRYIPAFRDSKEILKNEVRTLMKRIEDYTDITNHLQTEIEDTSKKLGGLIQGLRSIEKITALIEDIWCETHDSTLKHYQKTKLEATSTEIGELLRSISIKLSPSESGGSRDISELSDGQVSLFYFTLVMVFYDIEQKHHDDEGKLGLKKLDKEIPVLTIFAFEEPENHLSPFYLGRVLKVLINKMSSPRVMGIITSHSPSVVRRMDKVEQIRYFRQENNSANRYSVVKKILLPPQKSKEDYKYINQAVLAHPELYFSKLVLLGEGASEEIVIPKLAKILKIDLDPSFVAFVKLGGRHVNHMWKLLSDLKIPFLTLLDLDWGRANAGKKRIEYVVKELKKIPETSNQDKLSEILNRSISEDLDVDKMCNLATQLEEFGVYFSYPLDLDMAMIQVFPDSYQTDGAREENKREKLINAVLGEGHETRSNNVNWEKLYPIEELKKYRYLFCTRSKVASHYQAMDSILEDRNTNQEKCPDFVKRLINNCRNKIGGSSTGENG